MIKLGIVQLLLIFSLNLAPDMQLINFYSERRLLMVGGLDSDDKLLNLVEEYDIEVGFIKQHPTLSIPR